MYREWQLNRLIRHCRLNLYRIGSLFALLAASYYLRFARLSWLLWLLDVGVQSAPAHLSSTSCRHPEATVMCDLIWDRLLYNLILETGSHGIPTSRLVSHFMKNLVFRENLYRRATTIRLVYTLWCVLQDRGSDRWELLTSHRPLLRQHLGVICHIEVLVALSSDRMVADRILHGVIEIWAYPSFICFHEVVRVSWRLFLSLQL